MADIFLSYAQANADRAKQISEALSATIQSVSKNLSGRSSTNLSSSRRS